MLILDCTETMEMCCNMKPFLKIIDLFITVLQIGIPIVLTVLVAIDVFKMMVNGDGKENSKITKSIFTRFIYAALIFLVPWIIELSLTFIENFIINSEANGSTFTEIKSTSWIECWNHFDEENWCESNHCSDIYEEKE